MRLLIPDDVHFSDLRITRDPASGDVDFDMSPIHRILDASGIDRDDFAAGGEDQVSQLITAWYRVHLAEGGARDAVCDEIFAEADIESSRGQIVSHRPGRA